MSPRAPRLPPSTVLSVCVLVLLASPGCGHAPAKVEAPARTASPTREVSPGATSPAPCTSARLSLDEVGEDAGAGHRALHFRLRNTSGHVCTLEGYPEVRLLDDRGQPLAGLTFERRAEPAPVTLGAGGGAVFQLLVPSATGGRPCQAVTTVEVTPPTGGAALRLARAFDVCGSRVALMPLSAHTG